MGQFAIMVGQLVGYFIKLKVSYVFVLFCFFGQNALDVALLILVFRVVARRCGLRDRVATCSRRR